MCFGWARLEFVFQLDWRGSIGLPRGLVLVFGLRNISFCWIWQDVEEKKPLNYAMLSATR